MSGKFKLFFCSVFLFLCFQSAAFAVTTESLDSIGIQKIEGRTYIIHKVVNQETLFSISRRYKVQMSEIQQANEILKQGMKEGQMLLVPYRPINSSSGSAEPSSPTTATPVTVPAAPARNTTPEKAADPGSSTSVANPSSASTTPAKNDKSTASPAVESPVPNPSKSAPAVTIQKVKITHKVKSGESLSTIAKKYKVTIAELKSWNSLSSDKLSIGKSLKIITKKAVAVKQSDTQPQAEPLAANTADKKEEPKVADKKAEDTNGTKEVVFVSTKASTPTTKASGDWVTHTVKSGESLFSLAKMYGSSIEELIQWNSLTSNNIKVGQSIHVGRNTASGPPPATTSSSTTITTTTPIVTPTTSGDVIAEVKNEATAPTAEPKQETSVPNTSGGFTNTKETGLAEVIPGTEANKKYLVLHRNAPIGSVIRIKNEENDLTIFARVVGVLPETGDNSKVLIKLSKAAFEQLKGVNARFPVEVLY
jgi:LysM repeat protein